MKRAESETKTETETDKDTEIETETETDTQTHRCTDAQTRTDAQTHRHTDTQTQTHNRHASLCKNLDIVLYFSKNKMERFGLVEISFCDWSKMKGQKLFLSSRSYILSVYVPVFGKSTTSQKLFSFAVLAHLGLVANHNPNLTLNSTLTRTPFTAYTLNP